MRFASTGSGPMQAPFLNSQSFRTKRCVSTLYAQKDLPVVRRLRGYLGCTYSRLAVHVCEPLSEPKRGSGIAVIHKLCVAHASVQYLYYDAQWKSRQRHHLPSCRLCLGICHAQCSVLVKAPEMILVAAGVAARDASMILQSAIKKPTNGQARSSVAAGTKHG